MIVAAEYHHGRRRRKFAIVATGQHFGHFGRVIMATVTSGQPNMPRRSNALGVHSLNRFVFTVPDLAPAEAFYRSFGLDARRDANRLDLYTHGHPALLGQCLRERQAEATPVPELCRLRGRFRRAGAARAPRRRRRPASALGRGRARGRAMPTAPRFRSSSDPRCLRRPRPRTRRCLRRCPAKAPRRDVASAAPVRPRRLSHILLFSPDVARR